PGARRPEPLHRGRRPLRLAAEQEPDVDDPRPRLAGRGLHRGATACTEHLTPTAAAHVTVGHPCAFPDLEDGRLTAPPGWAPATRLTRSMVLRDGHCCG